MSKDTIVIYMADHGFFLGEHGFFDKRFMYEESLKTAFIVHWPGVVEKGVINAKDIVSNLDIASTFLDIAGIKIPKEIQGKVSFLYSKERLLRIGVKHFSTSILNWQITTSIRIVE